MKKTNNELEDDGLDLLDGLELDDKFDDDELIPKPSGDRNPVLRVAKGALAAFNPMVHGSDMIRTAAKKALPKSYVDAYDLIDSSSYRVRNAAEDMGKALNPAKIGLKSLIRKTIPFESRLIPSKIGKSLKEFSENQKDDNDGYRPKEITQDDQQSNEISNLVLTIFKAERLEKKQINKINDIKESITQKNEIKIHENNTRVSASIAEGVSRLVSYQDTVLDQYYRKSLEVQYLQMFAIKELLSFTKTASQNEFIYLQDIVKNTGLPNEAKVNLSEKFWDKAKEGLADSGIENIHDKIKKIPSTLFKNIKEKFTETGEQVDFILNSIPGADMDEDTKNMMGFDSYKDTSESIVGDTFRDKLVERGGEYVKGKLPSGLVKRGDYILSRITKHYPAMFYRWLLEKQETASPDSLENLMTELATDSLVQENTSFNKLSSSHDKVSFFDVLSRKTLTEIIPEYLSRSLEQLTNIYSALTGSTEKTDRLVYSVSEENLVPISGLHKRINSSFKSKIGDSVKSNTLKIINTIDPEKTLNNEERIELALFINKQSDIGKNFDVKDFIDNEEMPESIKEKVESLVTERFNMELDENFKLKPGNSTEILKMQRDLGKYYGDIQEYGGNFLPKTSKLAARGEKQRLMEVGIIGKNTGYYDPNYRINLLRDLFSSENREDFYRGDRPSSTSLMGDVPEESDNINEETINSLSELFFIDDIKKKIKEAKKKAKKKMVTLLEESSEETEELPEEESNDGGITLNEVKKKFKEASKKVIIKTIDLLEEPSEEEESNDNINLNEIKKKSKGTKKKAKKKTVTLLDELSEEPSKEEISNDNINLNEIKKKSKGTKKKKNSDTLSNVEIQETQIVDLDIPSENKIKLTPEQKAKLLIDSINNSKILQDIQLHVNQFNDLVGDKVQSFKSTISEKTNTDNIIQSIDGVLNKILEAITENTKKIKESTSVNHSPTDQSNGQLDNLITLNEEYAKSSISLLERIAIGVESINLSSTDGAILNDVERLKINQPDLMGKKSFVGRGIRFVKGGFIGLSRLRGALKPVREAVGNRAMGLMSSLFPGAWGLFKKTLGIPKTIISKSFGFLTESLAKVPDRVAKTGKIVSKIADNPLFNFAKKAITFTAENSYKAAKILLRKSIDTIVKIPYRTEKGFKRLDKIIKKPLGVLGMVGGAAITPFKYGFDYMKNRAFPTHIDVFKRDDAQNPVLTAQGFKNQEYFDKQSSKLLKSVKDIKGPVINAKGEVLVSQEMIDNGLMDKDHKQIDLPKLNNIRFFSKNNLPSIKDKVGDLLFATKSFFKKKHEDVFVKGEDKPRLYAELIKQEKYFDKKSGKPLKSVKDIKGEVVDESGNIILNDEDIEQGLVNVNNKLLYRKKNTDEKKLKIKKLFGLNLTSPGALLSSITDKVLQRDTEQYEETKEKENEVVVLLTNIYKHLQTVFPTKDSEEVHDERENSASNVLKRREAAKKAKEVVDNKKTKNEKEEDGEASNDKKETKGLFSGILNGIGSIATTIGTVAASIAGYFGISSLKDAALSKLKNLATGAKDLIVRNAPRALSTAGRAALVATPGVMTATGSALSTGATMVAGGLTAATGFLLTNPYGWGILLGGAALYGGYKLYKYASRRVKLTPLETLRYLQYGLPVENKHAVVMIRYFEEELVDDIKINKKGLPDVKRSVEQLWKDYASDFGSEDSNQTDYKNFTTWFNKRFLPVYVKHKIVAESLGCTISDTDSKLSPDLKYRFVNEVQFGIKEKEAGFDIYSITASPWHDIALADNEKVIKTLSDNVKNLLKRGLDVSLDNLTNIKETKPILLNVEKDTVKKDIKQQKDFLDDKKETINNTNIPNNSKVGSYVSHTVNPPKVEGVRQFLQHDKDRNIIKKDNYVDGGTPIGINDLSKENIISIQLTDEKNKDINQPVIKPVSNLILNEEKNIIESVNSKKLSTNLLPIIKDSSLKNTIMEVTKENEIIILLTNIYKHFKTVFPKKDSEQIHNERENSAINILKRKNTENKPISTNETTVEKPSRFGRFMGNVYDNIKNFVSDPIGQVQKAYKYGTQVISDNIIKPVTRAFRRVGNTFREQAGQLMLRIKQEFGLTDIQAAAIVGNLGHESDGLQAGIQERDVKKGRGGLGWAQWTGSRRVQFENLARQVGKPVSDPEVNYLMLYNELKGPYRKVIDKLKTTNDIKKAVYIFERGFEKSADVDRAGNIVKPNHYASRYNYAEESLKLASAAANDPSIQNLSEDTANSANTTSIKKPVTPFGINPPTEPTDSDGLPMFTEKDNTPILTSTKPLDGPTVEAANRLNIPNSTDTEIGLNLPIASNDSSNTVPRLPNKEPITITPDVIRAEEDNAKQLAKTVSPQTISVVSQNQVDLSEVNKSLETMNSSAGSQRSLHLAEQQKQTSLLAQLLSCTQVIANKPETKSTNLAVNQIQPQTKGGKPIISMERKIS